MIVDGANVAANGYRSLLSGNRWHFFMPLNGCLWADPSLVTYINILENNF